MSIESIGTGIKTVMGDIGLQIYATNEIPDSINPPCAVILLAETNYDTTFNADYDTRFRFIILLAKPDQPSAMNKILDYIEPSGTYSIVAKVKADKTLNGSCDSSKVMSNTGVGFTTWGGTVYLSTEFSIQTWA